MSRDAAAPTPPHPHGVQPLGAALLHGSVANVRDAGLGDLRILTDDILLRCLAWAAADSLVRFSGASRAAYCFASHDDLWRALVLQMVDVDFTFQASWKDTYAAMREAPTRRSAVRAQRRQRIGWAGQSDSVRRARHPPIRNMFSDVLYQGHLCRVHPVLSAWTHGEHQIPRRRHMSPAEFRSSFEEPNLPVVLEADPAVRSACRKWTKQYLRSKLTGRRVIAGDMSMPAESYFLYMDRQQDDMPLYMFDKSFADSCPDLAADYDVPAAFEHDLFSVLGPDRPDFRWLIVGPRHSGSTFHVDPNATSAWNACIRGRKLWVMVPPGATPPGVYASADGASVATPLSVMEWFINFFACLEELAGVRWQRALVSAGDVVFVPRGWWHCVLNLEDDTVAITHNFVSPANVNHVLAALESKNPDLVSGTALSERATLYDRFVAGLAAERPDLLASWQRSKDLDTRSRQLAGMFKHAAKEGELLSDKIGAPSDRPFCFGFSV